MQRLLITFSCTRKRSATIDHRNLQTLGYEIFKIKKKENRKTLEIIMEVFPSMKDIYNLRNRTMLHGSVIKRVKHLK